MGTAARLVNAIPAVCQAAPGLLSVLDLPLGTPSPHAPYAVMVNLLGDLWFDGPNASAPREPAWREVLAHAQAKLHLYGKAEPRRGRKMGHVTCLGATFDESLATARAVKRILDIPGADAL